MPELHQHFTLSVHLARAKTKSSPNNNPETVAIVIKHFHSLMTTGPDALRNRRRCDGARHRELKKLGIPQSGKAGAKQQSLPLPTTTTPYPIQYFQCYGARSFAHGGTCTGIAVLGALRSRRELQ